MGSFFVCYFPGRYFRFNRLGFRRWWRVSAPERNQEAQGGAELSGIAGVKALERGKNGGMGFGRVRHGEVIDVFMRHEHVAFGIPADTRAEVAALVPGDRFFHEGTRRPRHLQVTRSSTTWRSAKLRCLKSARAVATR